MTVIVDGSETTVSAQIGDSVERVLEAAGISIGPLDKVNPPPYTLLTSPVDIAVTRVREDFTTSEEPIAFSNQTVKNESLPEGQTLLIQPGQNGILQITTRIVYEDNREVSRTTHKTEVIQEPEPEILMVGVQTPFTTISFKGHLAYLTTGNAWIMEADTSNRRPVVTSGDLDGHVFSLSPDSQFLLFTRSENFEESGAINSLWALDLTNPNAEPFSLKAKNVIHYAEWIPGNTRAVTYSTVEPREAAPGWQANNDLWRVVFNSNETITQIDEIIGTNQGGDYGWWGTTYAWSPDGRRLGYARPDSIGLVSVEDGTLVPLLGLNAYSTQSNWAWVPPLGWSEDHLVLYTVNQSGNNETSPAGFSLTAILPNSGYSIELVENTGMFTYPSVSPQNQDDRYKVAYLQAIFPEKSDSSRYRLWTMDQDGSNRTPLFPDEGSLGLEPQIICWEPMGEDIEQQRLAFLYQGNLWFINTVTGETQQITGDGAINAIDWK